MKYANILQKDTDKSEDLTRIKLTVYSNSVNKQLSILTNNDASGIDNGNGDLFYYITQSLRQYIFIDKHIFDSIQLRINITMCQVQIYANANMF